LILDAFSRVLRHPDHANQPATDVLMEWLYAVLMEQPWQALDSLNDQDLTRSQITAVLSSAFDIIETNHDHRVIVSRSANAQALLDSLLAYARCYEDWQYRRWLHQAKATDFNHGH
jgi:hypothetical protein